MASSASAAAVPPAPVPLDAARRAFAEACADGAAACAATGGAAFHGACVDGAPLPSFSFSFPSELCTILRTLPPSPCVSARCTCFCTFRVSLSLVRSCLVRGCSPVSLLVRLLRCWGASEPDRAACSERVSTSPHCSCDRAGPVGSSFVECEITFLYPEGFGVAKFVRIGGGDDADPSFRRFADQQYCAHAFSLDC